MKTSQALCAKEIRKIPEERYKREDKESGVWEKAERKKTF